MANANKAGKAVKTVTEKNAKTTAPSTRRRAAKAPALPTREQALQALEHSLIWIVSERKLFTWTPLVAFGSEVHARLYANALDASANVSFNKYKVDSAIVQIKAFPGVSEGEIVGIDSLGSING